MIYNTDFTCGWPWIAINSYTKPTTCTNFSNLFLFFWNKTLHVSDSTSVHHQQFFTVHTAMVYAIQVCWQLASRIRTEAIQCIASTIYVCDLTMALNWGPKQFANLSEIKIQTRLVVFWITQIYSLLVQLVGFIVRNPQFPFHLHPGTDFARVPKRKLCIICVLSPWLLPVALYHFSTWDKSSFWIQSSKWRRVPARSADSVTLRHNVYRVFRAGYNFV